MRKLSLGICKLLIDDMPCSNTINTIGIIKLVLQYYPNELTNVIIGRRLSNIYHLLPSVDPPSIDCDEELMIDNPDEFVYLYSKGKARNAKLNIVVASKARHDVLKLIIPKYPTTEGELVAHYRLYKSMPDINVVDNIITRYIRLLCGEPVNINRCGDCTPLLWVMGDELYNENHIITMLGEHSDYESLISIHKDLNLIRLPKLTCTNYYSYLYYMTYYLSNVLMTWN